MKCCDIRINDLSERVTIERRSSSKSAVGAVTSSWSTLATVSANVKPKSTNERFQAMQLEAMTDTTVIIRYNATTSSITTKERVKFGSKYYNIQSVINIDYENRFLKLDCVENSEASL